jgi:hypothetical protein
MNRPVQHFRARLAVLMTGGALMAALFPMAGTALAATPTVTSATGGSLISADTFSTGTYTTLSGPSIVVAGAGDLTTGTITLTAPAGFEFATGVPNPSSSPGATGAAVSFTSATTSVVTFTVTGANTAAGTVVISGVRVLPTAGSPLASPGELQVGGTSSVSDATAGPLVEVPGAPILEFTTQPSSTATSATAFAQQPIITSLDRFDNPREGDSVTLSIKSGSGTTGAVLTCVPNSVSTNASGVAAFTSSGCKIDKSGSGYRLRASVTGATSVDSSTITVDPGFPVKIGFATQPARGIPGTPFGSQPVVAVQDAQGNTVPLSGATTVTLSLTTGSGTLTCTNSGGLTKGTSSGLAAFTGCRLTVVGVGFKITAAAPGYTSVASSAFDVADRLAFTTQPSGAAGGVAFTTQPVITVRAGASATAVNDNGSVVTLAIKSGTGATGATLTCTDGLTRTAVAGIATFAGCSIDKSSPTGSPYVLVATSPSLTSAESSTLAVVAGAASKVLFTVQPAATNVNVAFAAAPAVSITDAGGNVVTTGTSSTASVTLAIGTNPSAGTLTCTGGLSKAAVAGVATFTGCSINSAGVGYTLTAAATSLTSATSSAFTVTAPAAVIQLVRSTGMVTYGELAGFSIQFASSGSTRTFYLEHTSVGVPWTSIATLTTNSAGFATFSYTPTRSGYYRVRFDGTPDLSAATSAVVLVGVRQTVTLNPTHPGVLTIARGRSITFRSGVRPARLDLAPSSVTFRFYRKVDGAWVLRYERHVGTDASGVARTTFRFGVGGFWYVRAFADRTPYNAVSRFSQREVFLVR